MWQIIVSVCVFHNCLESPTWRDIAAPLYFVNGRDILYQPSYVSYERLNVEESVGQIFGRGVIGTLQIDPSARKSIRRVILNPNLKRFHSQAIIILSLEGDAEDVKLLSDYVDRRRGKELGVFVPTTVFDIFRTLAAMANRNVDGADANLRRMCDRKYWKDFSFEEKESAEWAYSDEVISSAVWNLARTRCADLDKIVEKTINETPAGARREGMKQELSAVHDDSRLDEYDWRIFRLIPPYSRSAALSNFNGDLENPGPRAVD